MRVMLAVASEPPVSLHQRTEHLRRAPHRTIAVTILRPHVGVQLRHGVRQGTIFMSCFEMRGVAVYSGL